MNIDFNKHIWEGWTVQDFIDEATEYIDMIMNHEAITDAFENKEQLKTWLRDNQPYYKKDIPEVIEFFANKYKLE